MALSIFSFVTFILLPNVKVWRRALARSHHRLVLFSFYVEVDFRVQRVLGYRFIHSFNSFCTQQDLALIHLWVPINLIHFI